MMRKIYYPLVLSLLMIAFGGCTTLNTDLTIPKKEIPASFQNQKHSSASIAGINWRHYFTNAHLLKLIDTALSDNFDLLTAL